ncbi:MAG: polysaccharide deacetylase family protein, partial [Actinomycetota bacterium]|nr:polysaccharide deacetylase family protein [Actinomycetota bacterium]
RIVTIALIYHDIAEATHRELVGFPGPTAARYKLAPERFEAHLDAIAAAARRVGLIEPGTLPSIALTFDDGGASALAAADILERRGWAGHFLVTSSRIGTPGFLTAEQIRDLSRRGHAVGSHSHTHPTYMGKLSRREIDDEWTRSRTILTDVLGVPPALASVPGGFLSNDVINGAAAAGYRVLLTSEPVIRATRANGLLCIGRFTIWARTPAERVGAYARGERRALARTWLEWNLKKLAKTSSPNGYELFRRRMASR